jgi:hypothetical protein
LFPRTGGRAVAARLAAEVVLDVAGRGPVGHYERERAPAPRRHARHRADVPHAVDARGTRALG